MNEGANRLQRQALTPILGFVEIPCQEPLRMRKYLHDPTAVNLIRQAAIRQSDIYATTLIDAKIKGDQKMFDKARERIDIAASEGARAAMFAMDAADTAIALFNELEDHQEERGLQAIKELKKKSDDDGDEEEDEDD
ncbi:hypothetical protein [Thioalkalivibrio sp. HK1]|uniref:hypothetical protein n=1 Tax=Thioalkalivibrio sp. HK1 TaxID=1469245 RepID=UPI0004717205|nr:hypothetical protein [Thioalkalivibrio sp. HK1]